MVFVCLFVCLYPINVKTAEPIETKFCVGPNVTPAKVTFFVFVLYLYKEMMLTDIYTIKS